MPIKHGLYGIPEYHAWRAMRDRCHRPTHPAYMNYGGRGIKVCERWNDFANFYADMGPRPKGLSGNGKRALHSLDRTNHNGDYEPSNCRWATWSEQENNRRDNVPDNEMICNACGKTFKRGKLKYNHLIEPSCSRHCSGLLAYQRRRRDAA